MEDHIALILARFPALRRIAMVLDEQPKIIVPPNLEHRRKALVDKDVLAPEAVTLALLLEVLLALVPASCP